MRLLHTGFDALDVAFQGALPKATIEHLLETKSEAAKLQDKVLTEIGPGNVEMHVHKAGLKGGYAIRTDTGPLGEIWAFKEDTNPKEWNIFVSVRAAALAVYGFRAVCKNLFARLEAMGAVVYAESVNRVDYALDFLTTDFELHLDQFVAHPRTKIRPYFGTKEPAKDNNQPTAVITGRKLESVTVGKMPGRQIIVYDKRAEAIAGRKGFWFEIWGIDRSDPTIKVWRVEIRAGKKELGTKYRLRTFADIEASIGDVYLNTVREIRYLADHQTDSNVSRQQVHPIWAMTTQHLETSMMEFRSGLLPGQIREVYRKEAEEMYLSLIVGNSAGFAVALGLDDEEIETDLASIIADCVRSAINDPDGRMTKKMDRARERMRFVLE